MPRQSPASATPINASYSTEPLYGGARFTPSQVANVQPIALESPVAGELRQGIAAQTQAMSALDQALIERNDYTLGLMRKAEMAQLEASAKAELEARMNAVDGDPDSFYDANHQPRLDAQEAFVNKYKSLTDNLSRGFIGYQAQEQARSMQENFQNSLQPLVATKFLEQGMIRAKSAFDNNFYALLASGQFNEAIKSLQSGFQNGAVAPREASGYYNAVKSAFSKSKVAGAKSGAAITPLGKIMAANGYTMGSGKPVEETSEAQESPEEEIILPLDLQNLD